MIILDFAMPLMNGLEAARVLKQTMPAVILIMYSAAFDEFSEHLAMSAGISGLISKSEKVSMLIEKARVRHGLHGGPAGFEVQSAATGDAGASGPWRAGGAGAAWR